MRFSGAGASALMAPESGGHRWQRIPPTERGGRVHSSTVTVAVLPENQSSSPVEIRDGDVIVKTSRGSGPGGQKRNKTDSAVTLHHVPTGMIVHCESEVSQNQNKAQAFSVLRSRLEQQRQSKTHRDRNDSRSSQIGSGMRADKIRTVQVKNGVVTNHLNGRKCPVATYLKGDLSKIQ